MISVLHDGLHAFAILSPNDNDATRKRTRALVNANAIGTREIPERHANPLLMYTLAAAIRRRHRTMAGLVQMQSRC